ncbi:MAG TPA: methyltransferase domain-containing protein [Candidatus Thermoplasmatota archaeon]|nr:methyltransferase domain-containing protein [Candidatus Thermoplasmatota archaeon]
MAAATAEMVQAAVDGAKTEAFAGKVLGDGAGTFAFVCCAVGDKLGLFKDLAAHGPQTSAELAACLGLSERYVREWASCLSTAGYLSYDPSKGRFALPPEHAPVLAQEGGPAFFGGIFQQTGALLTLYEPLLKAFKDGKGIPPSLYGEDIWKGELRSNDMWHENLLVQTWIPLMPDLKARLEAGARVADIGCGSGKALVRMAQAFPKSSYVGYDIDPGSVARAAALAKADGVDGRVRFEVRDLTKGVPHGFDVITAFDVVHDTADPLGVFTGVRSALNPGGTFMLLEINGADRLEDNAAPLGPIFYGISLLFCMSIAVARGGEGLGTAGLHNARVREYAAKAGFASVKRVDINNPINVLYEVRA